MGGRPHLSYILPSSSPRLGQYRIIPLGVHKQLAQSCHLAVFVWVVCRYTNIQGPDHIDTSLSESSHQTTWQRSDSKLSHNHSTVRTIRPFRLCKCAFRCSAPATWNSLPRTVTDSNSLGTFKSGLKRFLFSPAHSWNWHNLPPAPLKSWPDGTTEIRLLLSLLLHTQSQLVSTVLDN